MARRRDDYEDFEDYGWYYSSPIKPRDGIKSRSQRGKFASSWWGQRWLKVLESYGIGSRLQRGRSYARGGQVTKIEMQPGLVKAKVQGSRPKPYDITLQLPPLQNSEWEKVLDAISAQAIFTAQLLNSEMPQEIEQAFDTARVPLFPARGKDLVTRCSCPDDANPCKHIAAVYYLIGEQFDTDPFLIFTLRGRTRDQIIEALRARRAAAAGIDGEAVEEAIEPVPSLTDQLDTFWGADRDGEFSTPSLTAPDINAAMLRRLGTSPGLIDKELKAIYAAMTQHVLRKVFGDEALGEIA